MILSVPDWREVLRLLTGKVDWERVGQDGACCLWARKDGERGVWQEARIATLFPSDDSVCVQVWFEEKC